MKNKFEIRGEVTVIYVGRKGVTYECLIDTEDLEKVSRLNSDRFDFKWVAKRNKRSSLLYANKFQSNDVVKNCTMHRLIMDAPSDKHVDHINHNTLDNRKANLRLANHSENQQNKEKIYSNSGRLCVTWHKQCKKWQAAIKVNGKNIYLGLFENIDDAANAVTKAREIHMPFSVEATKKRNEGVSA